MTVYKKQDMFSVEKGMRHGDVLLLRERKIEYVFLFSFLDKVYEGHAFLFIKESNFILK